MDQSIRASNAAEQAVLVSYYQAWTAFWQTFATIAAFCATAIAAFYAYRLAKDSARSIDLVERSLKHSENVFAADHRARYVFKEIELEINECGRIIGNISLFAKGYFHATNVCGHLGIKYYVGKIPSFLPDDLIGHNELLKIESGNTKIIRWRINADPVDAAIKGGVYCIVGRITYSYGPDHHIMTRHQLFGFQSDTLSGPFKKIRVPGYWVDQQVA